MATRSGAGRQRLVVVGNGMAGARTVEEVLARGGAERFDITVYGEEPYGNYNRILLSHVLQGVDDEADIFLNTVAWYAENGIDLRSGVRVQRIDPFGKVVVDGAGGTQPYDRLVIATGSVPFVPDIAHLRDPRRGFHQAVFTFRTLDDTRRMVAYARDHERAVVIGGGLLGLEAAAGLASHGMRVTVVHGPGHLMNAQLDEAAGRILRRSIEALGIEVECGARTTAVRGREQIEGIELRDGRFLPCDMVVLAAGIRPSTEIAEMSGLTVERGIVVDDQMRVPESDDVFAVGECVQHRGETYGLVAPIWEQAKVIADVLTGADPHAAYHGTRTATKLKVAGVDVASMGVVAPERDTDEHVVLSEPRRGVHRSVVIRDGRLIGATLLGDVGRAAFLQGAFERGTALPEERLSLLLDLGGPPAEVSVAELDDHATVCTCNGVSKGAICGAVTGGCRTVGSVMDATRAGKGCGSCKGLVAQVVEWAAGGAVEEDPSASWYVPGIPLTKAELVEQIRARRLLSVSSVFAALAPEGADDARSKMALTSLLRVVWPHDHVDERDARFVNDRVHANIQRDGTFSVVPQMKGGVTTPEQLRTIADVADRYHVPLVKVTGGQRIDLLGVPKEDLPKVWRDLGMPSGYAYGKSFRTVKTCVGTDFCRFGLGDSTQLGIDLESRYQGLESPAKMKLAVSGCPRNCAESLVKDVGVVAVGEGRWDVLVGGAAGAHIRQGDVLATVDSPEEVVRLAGRFMQYYRENAGWLERTYTFVPRVGIERLRALLVEDGEGLAAGLDERMQEAVDAYVDPWQEGAAPVEPGQFRTALPLTPLPQVPVR
ncbi:nitrite reductase large subunit NirB [Cellulomonas endophytica]|uniref:nitrite reductase large subunit NirB n=1 Tax=Cellulomonas endophytica TaxID=2494735 RepID=UPI0023EA6290|nr:nitrite reductase large subunit NirB [Cellulomonas endophytica]